MSIEIKKTLPIRVSAALGLSALAFIVLSSLVFFDRTYTKQLAVIGGTFDQLVSTVGNSAAIAAYLGNTELAADVANGLASNDIVERATVMGHNGLRQSSGGVTRDGDVPLYRVTLNAPFPPAEPVGEILIVPNQALMERRARQAALDQVLTLANYTLVLMALVAFITHLLLTRPIRAIAAQVHEIEPGASQRLVAPKWHQKNEIGELVNDTNRLLDSVTATLHRERALRAEVESLGRRFRLIFERASGGIALIHPDGRLHLYNPSFARIFGEARLEAMLNQASPGFPALFKNADDVRRALIDVPGSTVPLAKDLQLPAEPGAPARWVHGLFSSVTDESGELLIESIVYDISERTYREQKMRFEAERDPLTGLFNRRAGERLIARILERAARENQHCALLMIDLDRFKPINDTHGHDAGDRVLVEISRRLSEVVRGSDLTARWGGDEFLVMLAPTSESPDVTPVADKILARVAEAIDLGNGHHGQVGASIGIALYPDHGISAEQLIDRADRAMYRVKDQGRNGYQLSTDERAAS